MKPSPLSMNAPAMAGSTANASGMLCHVDDSAAVGTNISSVLALNKTRASSRLISERREFRRGKSEADGLPTGPLAVGLGVLIGAVGWLDPSALRYDEGPVGLSGD